MNYEYEVKIGEPATIPLGVDDNSVELSAEEIPIKVPQIAKTTDVLKGDDNGNAIAAEAGVDYQTPLEAGVDYQTPLTAGVDYQTPLTAGTDYQTPLPSQSGKSGKYLKTDGSDMSWADVPVPPVTSVNNKTGAVTLGAADVGALPDSYTPPVTSVNGSTGAVVITASGLGAYEKPAGGIPAADLADYYAASATAGGTASKTEAIPYGVVDNTSTSTVYTATVPGITELKDGTMMLLKNGVITSAAGFTININNLGAKPVYTNLAAATAESTKFNVNYTMLFIYDSTRVTGGCWICYNGYDSNTNTIGYQLRTQNQSMPMKSITYRYRILFTSADHKHFVPATNSTSTNATAARAVCQDPIDPFGAMYYYGTTTSVAAGSRPSTSYLWQQYSFSLGYSFNNGSALTLTSWEPVYIVATPQSDGSAIIDSTTPYTQTLPTTEDGKIYIYLGVAYSATQVEMLINHPVYWYKNGRVRPYTDA